MFNKPTVSNSGSKYQHIHECSLMEPIVEYFQINPHAYSLHGRTAAHFCACIFHPNARINPKPVNPFAGCSNGFSGEIRCCSLMNWIKICALPYFSDNTWGKKQFLTIFYLYLKHTVVPAQHSKRESCSSLKGWGGTINCWDESYFGAVTVGLTSLWSPKLWQET